MTRTDRLTGIILALQGGRHTAAQLAARFEVSRRTILRDVDALSQIGVPVVALPGPGGGLALADGYWLPPLHLSAAEAAVLLLALRALGEPAATPFGEARRGAEEKLRAVLRPDVLAAADRELDTVDAAPPHRPLDPGHVRAIRAAIRNQRWLRVDYGSLRRVAAHHLLPRRLTVVDGRWYVAALSLEAAEERSYRLDRVRSLAPVPPPPGADAADRAAARPRRPYDDPSHPEVVVRLSYRGLRLAEASPNWTRSAAQLGPDLWELRFRSPPAELPYHARAIHALGPTAEAVAPPQLRALILDLAAATTALYADRAEPRDRPPNGDGTLSPTPPYDGPIARRRVRDGPTTTARPPSAASADNRKETSVTSTDRALAFLDAHGRPLELAWARHLIAGDARQSALDALAAYQNPDGGFGRALEPDIKAPDSQAFAARLAMHLLLSLGAAPDEPLVRRLEGWLDAAQHDDGDWHFPPGVREHDLAPWFAAWTFPSLNPALNLAGLATRLGIGSARLHKRVRSLADRLAATAEIQEGGFYQLLPYAEYFPWVDHPNREPVLAALSARIETDARAGAYDDAGHFFEHLGPPDGELARRLPPDVIAAQLDRLLAEQQPDGGWPSPYDPAWRSWATASALATLHAFDRT